MLSIFTLQISNKLYFSIVVFIVSSLSPLSIIYKSIPDRIVWPSLICVILWRCHCLRFHYFHTYFSLFHFRNVIVWRCVCEYRMFVSLCVELVERIGRLIVVQFRDLILFANVVHWGWVPCVNVLCNWLAIESVYTKSEYSWIYCVSFSIGFNCFWAQIYNLE